MKRGQELEIPTILTHVIHAGEGSACVSPAALHLVTDTQCAAEDSEQGETEDERNSLYTHLEAQSPSNC